MNKRVKNKSFHIFSSLYFKISIVFLLVLLIFTSITIYIAVRAADNYALEVNQQLNRKLASNTVDVIKPFVDKGEINEAAIEDIVHSMMVINPSVEVYLLDPAGKILSYVAPKKVVKLEQVSLDPILAFLRDTSGSVILGDDPRNPGDTKIFSADKVYQKGELIGYIYIVLASQEYISATHLVKGSYILGLSIKSVIIVLLISALLGLAGFWFITKKLNTITRGISKFREGDLTTRIPVKDDGELEKIGMVFNQMAATIEQNIKDLKGIDDLRKELLSNVSHDLRTPIASIQGYAETLILKNDTIKKKEQKKYLQIIYKNCEKLKKLVSELFELSKLQSDQVDLHPEPFIIGELVQDIANKYRLISKKKGISLDIIVAKNAPLVKADISMIERALQNLIDNAIKFCKNGDTITVEVNTTRNDKVEIRISDSGIGIEKEELPYIFERYYKSPGGKADSSGLGLAIVKKILELHQSNITVLSQPRKGTTFTFQLPIA